MYYLRFIRKLNKLALIVYPVLRKIDWYLNMLNKTY